MKKGGEAVMRKEKKKNRIKFFVNSLENPLKIRLSCNIYKCYNITSEIRLAETVLTTISSSSVVSLTTSCEKNSLVQNIPCAGNVALLQLKKSSEGR